MAEADDDWLDAGRLLFAQPCHFIWGAQRLDGLPEERGPEIAFAGRSNVGKSSLLNALTGQRALARVSQMPGRTQQLNFFALGEDRLILVDMPGYGYARASRSIQRDWQTTMFDFLRGRAALRRVMLLLDAKVGVKASDRAALDLLDRAAVAYTLVLTKADGLAPDDLAARAEEVSQLARARAAAFPRVLATSAARGTGIDALRAELARVAAPPRNG